MDPSGSKRKGGLIPVKSLKKQKGQDGKACFFVGAEEIYVVRQKKEKIVLSKRRKKGRD